MHDSTSAGPQRSRVQRGLGVLVGAALLVTPFAAAPAAQAQAGPTSPETFADLIQQIIEGLAPQTLPHPLGEKAQNPTQTCKPGYADGLGSTLTCLIAALDGPVQAKARVKATTRRGKVRSVRWVGR